MTNLFEDVQWQTVVDDFATTPQEAYATHQGVLQTGTIPLTCYRFSDGTIALDVEEIETFFRGCPNCATPASCTRRYSTCFQDLALMEHRLTLLLHDDD